MKTSIKIKRFWYADPAPDGGLGTNWKEVQIGQREGTVQFNGSAASVNNYKNVLGDNLESSLVKGDKTMNFQLADLTPDVIAAFTGGSVVSDSTSDRYECPENENQSIEKSIKFLTDRNILVTIPRCAIDAYPIINDDDLHYYQIDSTVLKPTKSGVKTYTMDTLKIVDANDIVSFSFGALIDSAPATISTSLHTVALTVVALTVVTALVPVIGVSLGASITPESGEADNFTSPVVYSVKAANGEIQAWTVTITVTP